MRVLDLFSGIGGFSLGLERAGMRTVGFCEIDPFCRRVLAKHWPGVPCADDITTRDFVEGEADVVCGGFPCQDISCAGEGAGLAGARSGLWRELARAVRLVRPRHAIVENVAALLNRGMGDVLGDLAEIGYDAEWHCIPASAVGAPHRRDRVWIIADARSEQHESDRAPYSGALAAQLSSALADADSEARRPEARDANHSAGAEALFAGTAEPGRCGAHLADADGARLEVIVDGDAGQCAATLRGRGQWSVEPDVGRVAHGVPSRVDRLRGLGNAVVPQVVETIGRAVKQLFLP